MIRAQFVLFALLLCGIAYGQIYENFEGTYTSQYGLGLYVCQNGNFVQASYDEAGLIRCTVNAQTGLCEGHFWEAGSGLCNTGAFQMQITANGINGNYTCNGIDGIFEFNEHQMSNFRPTDNQCALLSYSDGYDDDDEDDYTLEGRWSDKDDLPTDICFLDDDDDRDIGQVVMSYDYMLDGEATEGYVSGFHSLDGKIAIGTWYEDLNAGAIIYFVRNNREVGAYWWTGLVGRRGYTFIDPAQANNPDFHDVISFNDRAATEQSVCERYSILKRFVLKNVRFTDDDEDGYYFVDPYFQPEVNIAEAYGYFATSSSSSTLIASVFTIASAMLLVLFF